VARRKAREGVAEVGAVELGVFVHLSSKESLTYLEDYMDEADPKFL